MMKSTLGEWLALTPTERKVALVLVGAFILGLCVRLYWQTFPPQRTFDYTASDSTFAALSTAEEKTPNDHIAEPAGPLNINTATKSELMSLPGIGEVTAERIIAHRNDAGAFSTIEELRKIKGISKLKLQKLKPLITVH